MDERPSITQNFEIGFVMDLFISGGPLLGDIAMAHHHFSSQINAINGPAIWLVVCLPKAKIDPLVN